MPIGAAPSSEHATIVLYGHVRPCFFGWKEQQQETKWVGGMKVWCQQKLFGRGSLLPFLL
jgi:hypothetical protein